MRNVVFIVMAIAGFLAAVNLRASELKPLVPCEALLSSPEADITTQHFLGLFSSLVKSRAGLTVEAIKQVADSGEPVNPIDFVVETLDPQTKFAFRSVFDRLLKNQKLDWDKVREKLGEFVHERTKNDEIRKISNRRMTASWAPVKLDRDFHDLYGISSGIPFLSRKGKLYYAFRPREGGGVTILNVLTGEHKTFRPEANSDRLYTGEFFETASGKVLFTIADYNGEIHLIDVKRQQEIRRPIVPIKIAALKEFIAPAAGLDAQRVYIPYEPSRGKLRLLAHWEVDNTFRYPSGEMSAVIDPRNISRSKFIKESRGDWVYARSHDGKSVYAAGVSKDAKTNKLWIRNVTASGERLFETELEGFNGLSGEMWSSVQEELALHESGGGDVYAAVHMGKEIRVFNATRKEVESYPISMSQNERRVNARFIAKRRVEFFETAQGEVFALLQYARTRLLLDVARKTTVELSDEIGQQQETHVVKTKDGKTYLVSSREVDEKLKSVHVFDVMAGGRELVIQLGQTGLDELLLPYATSDGRIEALMLSGSEPVVYQLLGKVP